MVKLSEAAENRSTLRCTACGVECDAPCECGAPFQLLRPGQAAFIAVTAHPERSDRALASQLGVDHKTVAAAREATGENSPVERIGLDGKARRLPANEQTVTYVNVKGDMVTATATTRWPPNQGERYVGPWPPSRMKPKPAPLIDHGCGRGPHLPLDDNQIVTLWLRPLWRIQGWVRDEDHKKLSPEEANRLRKEIRKTIKVLNKALSELDAIAPETATDKRSAVVN